MSRAVAALLGAAIQLVIVVPADGPAAKPDEPQPVAAVSAVDVFQPPLPSWSPHCLGFGSQWRYCNGVALRACASGAVWLHTGVDVVARAGEPVVAAGDGVIAGYLIDAQFRGGVLIRHRTTVASGDEGFEARSRNSDGAMAAGKEGALGARKRDWRIISLLRARTPGKAGSGTRLARGCDGEARR